MPGERGLLCTTVGSLVNPQSFDHRQRYIVNSRCFLAPKSLYLGVECSDHGYFPQCMPTQHFTRVRYQAHRRSLEPKYGFKHCTALSSFLVNPVAPMDAFRAQRARQRIPPLSYSPLGIVGAKTGFKKGRKDQCEYTLLLSWLV